MTAQEKSEAVSDVAKNELNTTNVNDDSSLQKVLSDSSEHSQYDSAYTFVQDVDDLEYEVSPKLLRKLDLRILTILCGIYFLHFLDKTLLNYAAAMGIKKNLANPNDFANLSTIFYASYIVGVPVVAYMLQKWSLSRTLGIFIILWGVVVAVHAACKNYVGLMLVRTFLGFLESSSAISLIVISGMYYSKSLQAARMGWWCIMAGLATIVGGLLSFGFQYIHLTTFKSWQILFLVMGIITILFGLLVLFFLPDSVHEAKFLTRDEKLAVLKIVRDNQTGTISHKVKMSHITEILFHDPLTWPFFLLCLVSQIVTGAVGSFSVTITLSFGFSPKESALLQIPTGTIIALIIYISSMLVAKYGHIATVMASMFIPSIIGCVVMLTMDIHKHPLANLFSLYLLYSGSCTITLIYIWGSLNTAGTTKKFARSGLTMLALSLASIIGPQMFQANTAPEYRPAKIALLVTQVVSLPLTAWVAYLARRENLAKQKVVVGDAPRGHEFLDLTEMENKWFKYSY